MRVLTSWRTTSNGLAGAVAAAAISAAAGLFVVSFEPRIVLGVMLSGIVLAVAWRRASWAVGLLVFTTILGTAGPSLVRDAGQATRAVALLAVSLVAARVLVLGRRAPVWALVFPFAPLLLGLGLSIVAAPAVPPDAEALLPLAALLIAAAVVAWHLSDAPDEGESVLRAIAVAYAFVAVMNVGALLASPSGAFLAADGPRRFQGLFENPNAVGALAFGGVPALMGAALLRRPGSNARRLYFCLAGLLSIEALLSLSRSGLAGLTVSAVIMFVGLTGRQLGTRLGVAGLAACGLLLVITSGALTTFAQSLRLTSLSEASGRGEVYPQLLTTALDRPLLGHGYGTGDDVVDAVQASLGVTSGYAGNVFLDVGVAAGFVGIAALVTTLVICGRRAAIALRSENRERVIVVTWLAIAVGGFVNSQGEALLLTPGSVGGPAFWFAMAMLSALGLRRDAATSSEPLNVAGAAGSHVRHT